MSLWECWFISNISKWFHMVIRLIQCFTTSHFGVQRTPENHTSSTWCPSTSVATNPEFTRACWSSLGTSASIGFLVDVSSMIQLAQKKIEQKVVPKPTSDEMTRCEIKPFVLTNWNGCWNNIILLGGNFWGCKLHSEFSWVRSEHISPALLINWLSDRVCVYFGELQGPVTEDDDN